MKNILRTLVIAMLAFTVISCSEDDPVSDQHDHAEADGMVIKSNGNIILKIDEAEIDPNYFEKLSIKENSTMSDLEVFFIDHDGDEFQPHDEDKSFGWVIGDESILQLIPDSENMWQFDLEGLKEGMTDLEIRILHNDHPDFKTPKIPVEITK